MPASQTHWCVPICSHGLLYSHCLTVTDVGPALACRRWTVLSLLNRSWRQMCATSSNWMGLPCAWTTVMLPNQQLPFQLLPAQTGCALAAALSTSPGITCLLPQDVQHNQLWSWFLSTSAVLHTQGNKRSRLPVLPHHVCIAASCSLSSLPSLLWLLAMVSQSEPK